MEGEWSCYRGGQFKEGRMNVMEVVTLMEGERSSEGHQCSVLWRESGHVTVVVSLKEGEWSC